MIGEGAYGKIFISTVGNINVAVKIISKKGKSNEYLEKFLPRELEAASKLKHENIINVFDVMESKNSVYIVMELAQGGDLLDKITEEGPLSKEEAQKIFKQIVEAVEYMHRQNMAHRDLKLENILLDSECKVKVTDFGFSKTVQKNELSNTFCGSAVYTAPEILKGEAYDAFKADVWSLGVILYGLVYGALPFQEGSIIQVVQKTISLPQMKVDKDCEELIISMLEPEAAKRANLSDILSSKWFN
ncbi:hypothetical protein ACJMK2_039710 [Sinanodonta woodiana]|uniref:Protein kinase domain-containing protein n=2 Tax=Sinanodonta woodiana TaxID=1069815 RepID=A0ABD3WDS0_SINWO